MGTKFFLPVGVSCSTISSQSFNGLCCKLAKIALFIYQYFIIIIHVILGRVYDVTSHLICIFYTFFKLRYLWN